MPDMVSFGVSRVKYTTKRDVSEKYRKSDLDDSVDALTKITLCYLRTNNYSKGPSVFRINHSWFGYFTIKNEL